MKETPSVSSETVPPIEHTADNGLVYSDGDFSPMLFAMVMGGLVVLMGLFVALMGLGVVTFVLVTVLGICMALAGGLAVCMFISGRKLRQRKSRMFSLIIAGIECLMMPFGTILGIFTLMTLNNASVKELYRKSI